MVRAGRNEWLLAGFTSLTNTADAVTRVALPLLTLQLTRSPALVATVVAAGFGIALGATGVVYVLGAVFLFLLRGNFAVQRVRERAPMHTEIRERTTVSLAEQSA